MTLDQGKKENYCKVIDRNLDLDACLEPRECQSQTVLNCCLTNTDLI